MELVFMKKDKFIILAKQLKNEDLKKLKPHVDKMYNYINAYLYTCNEIILYKLYYLLLKCINYVQKTLLNKKSFVRHRLYVISE
nr:unknown [Darna trima granulovirus]